MKVYFLLTTLLAALMCVQAKLAPPERHYKILMLLPVSSKSHRNVFMSLAEALADRGHKVIMLTNHPASSNHTNILEIDHKLPHFREEDFSMFDSRKDPSGGFSSFQVILNSMARDLYRVESVKKIFDRRKSFDLMIIDNLFNELAYPFAHETTFIALVPGAVDYRQSAVLGNVLNPSYVPTFLQDYPQPMSLVDRAHNLGHMLAVGIYWRNWAILPRVQEVISILFPDFPTLLEIERNQSLSLINSHFSLGQSAPLLPSQVEVGGMHCRPSKPLPQDLQDWIDGAGELGVIYFSLGSVTKGTSMPIEYRNLFIEAFKLVQQRVIWKFEGELNVTENVLVSSWLPQQDILAHPNVKVFISHGGLLSTQEAIYHATPVLALPIFGDQPQNAAQIQNAGFGKMLIWEELTVDAILNALKIIIQNPTFEMKLNETSKAFRDQIQPPLERAVFWTEYVVRHRGAPQLRSPAAQLPWVQFLMLDVFALFLGVDLLLLYLLRACFRAIYRKKNSTTRGNNNNNKKTD